MAYKDLDKQKEYQRVWQAARRLAVRNAVLDYMGGKCAGCSIDDYRVLQIDHIEPELRKAKDWTSKLVFSIYRDKTKANGLQLLCANCHAIKTNEIDRRKFAQVQKNVHNFNPRVMQVKPIV